MTTVTRLFDTYEHASAAVNALEGAGIPHSDISLVANNAEGTLGTGTAHTHAETGEGAGAGATIGTVLGGGAGLLAGLGMLAIPAWARWSQPAGSWPPRSAPASARLRAGCSARWSVPA